MPEGTIKKAFKDMGFGFISREKLEIYFDQSALSGTTIESLEEGQSVEYDERRGPRGPRAENVRPS